MAKSLVFEHFCLPENVQDDTNFKAKCKHCDSPVSGSKLATSNFLTHMKRHHLKIYQDIKNGKSEASSQGQAQVTEYMVEKRKWKLSDERQISLTDSVVTYIAKDLLPLSTVESPAFRELFEKAQPCFTMPSRKHLTSKLLPQKCQSIIQDMKTKLASIESIHVTLDLWSSRDMRSFMGITGHFIKDYTLHSMMISCKRFFGSHTGEAIHESYSEILSNFDISMKVRCAVTDSASNMVKAFQLPGYVHYVGADEESDDEVDLFEPLPLDFIDDYNILEDTNGPPLFPERVSCFSHTLQLVVKDGLKDASQLKTIISKASSLVSHARKSHHVSELLEKCNKLQLANATRWNSQLKMIRSILNVPQEIMDKIDFANKPRTHEIKIMNDLCTILTPFEKATNESQGQNTVTCSKVIIIIRTLREELESLSRNFNCRLLTSLKQSVEKRLSKYEEMKNFQLATALDPHYKLDWCTDDEVKKVRSTLLKAGENIFQQSMRTEDQQGERPPSPKRSRPLFMKDRSKSSNPVGILQEVTDYLSKRCIGDEENTLVFWEKNAGNYPTLARLATIYLSMPASSGPVERLFSIGGKIFRADRCSLNNTTFENLMIIKCNNI